ncbi:hypothetical protein [Ensifer sp. Root278]|uniref:hypothetical protein n=1 Tax=Ensifer sp. Root278 TaxID=1736509 RepID=UPI001FCCDDC2|nr:hypothetical protein [Ensifer sp. Root278]
MAKNCRFDPRANLIRTRGRLVVKEKEAPFRLQQPYQRSKLTRGIAPPKDADADRKHLVEAAMIQIE